MLGPHASFVAFVPFSSCSAGYGVCRAVVQTLYRQLNIAKIRKLPAATGVCAERLRQGDVERESNGGAGRGAERANEALSDRDAFSPLDRGKPPRKSRGVRGKCIFRQQLGQDGSFSARASTSCFFSNREVSAAALKLETDARAHVFATRVVITCA